MKKKKVDIWRRVDSRLWQPLCSESAPFSRILHRRPCRRLLLDWPISWRRTNGLGLGRCCQRLTKKKLCCRHRICPLASAAPRTHRQEKPPNRRTTCKPKSAGPAPNRRPRNKKGKKGRPKRTVSIWTTKKGGVVIAVVIVCLFFAQSMLRPAFSLFFIIFFYTQTHIPIMCSAMRVYCSSLALVDLARKKKRQRHAARKKRENQNRY